MSKSAFKVIAEAVVHGIDSDINLPTESLDATRKITVDELKSIVKEEFGKAKSVADVKAKEVRYWGAADLANEVDWVKSLKIREFFDIDNKKS